MAITTIDAGPKVKIRPKLAKRQNLHSIRNDGRLLRKSKPKEQGNEQLYMQDNGQAHY